MNEDTYVIGAITNEDLSDIEYREVQKIFHSQKICCQVRVFRKLLFRNSVLHISGSNKTAKRRSCYCVFKKAGSGLMLAQINKFVNSPLLGTVVFVQAF